MKIKRVIVSFTEKASFSTQLIGTLLSAIMTDRNLVRARHYTRTAQLAAHCLSTQLLGEFRSSSAPDVLATVRPIRTYDVSKVV